MNDSENSTRWSKLWIGLLLVGIVLVLLIAIRETAARRDSFRQRHSDLEPVPEHARRRSDTAPLPPRSALTPAAPQSPAEVVSNKVSQFSRSRREITYAFGSKFGVSVPREVQEFYEAVEAGDWERTKDLYTKLWKKKDSDEPGAEDIRRLSAPLLETYGVAEAAHLWPPETLLQYGESVLGSLKPGMMYIGGTDSGRFIPTLLNEAADPSERRIILTQNALADGVYRDYVDFLYGDQMHAPSPEQSEAAFQGYIDDAKRRFEHDRDFPQEPKQLRPGESVQMTDGKISVSGVQAVMNINERILNAFIAKNPGLSIAFEESFPFKSTYSAARPLGPIFEINSPEGENAFTAEAANTSLQYWQETARNLASDPQSANSPEALKTYSHMAKAHAAFFQERALPEQAEQAYQLARQIYPGNIEAAAGLSDLYMRQGRPAEGEKILADFERQFPDQKKQVDTWRLRRSLLPPKEP